MQLWGCNKGVTTVTLIQTLKKTIVAIRTVRELLEMEGYTSPSQTNLYEQEGFMERNRRQKGTRK